MLPLETAFHEAMHQWDDSVVAALRTEARAQGVRVSRTLSHALIFFTAGETVRRVLPGHVPYAEAAGVWDRGMSAFPPVLRAVWLPYLDGAGTRDAAFAELVRRTGTPPR